MQGERKTFILTRKSYLSHGFHLESCIFVEQATTSPRPAGKEENNKEVITTDRINTMIFKILALIWIIGEVWKAMTGRSN